MKKAIALSLPVLAAAAGIALLFVLEPKIWGVLLILLGLAWGFTVFRRVKHPETAGSVTETAALFRDRFHRARHAGGGSSH